MIGEIPYNIREMLFAKSNKPHNFALRKSETDTAPMSDVSYFLSTKRKAILHPETTAIRHNCFVSIGVILCVIRFIGIG